MGRVYEKFVGTYLGGSINVSKAVPLDVKTVVQSIADLTSDELLVSVYEGLVVYVVDEKSLYVCHSKPEDDYLENVEDGWKKVDVDYSVRIVESENDLKTILFPYQGMMAYVESESSLYILMTTGVSKAKEIGNWRKISAASSATLTDKVGIDVAPEGGSGFKIIGNIDETIDDYINVENYIKAKYNYTSKGINSFDPNPNFTYDKVILSKGGNSYIELYANGNNWMSINDPDNSLGLSELSGNTFAKGKPVCFGIDINFTDGWTISYGGATREFVDSDYELIDIYRNELLPEVYVYRNDIDMRMLTEEDLADIDDKIDNLAHSIMIDLGETPSEPGESEGGDLPGESEGDTNVSTPVPLQQVIVQMNNSINKLEQTVVEPDPIGDSDIDELFS
jgi:hypothetical protein